MDNITKTTSTEITSHPFYWPWLVWGLSALFYFYEYFLQVSPGVMVPELMQTFKVNAAALGNLAAFYFYAYATMQIPVGILLDRYGPRRLLTFATSTCMVGCLLFGSATSLLMAQIGRFCIGLGSAFAIISCLKIVTLYFPPQRFALLTGMTITVGMLGAVGGETPLALLVHFIGWRASIVALGIIGGLLAIQIWRIVRDNPLFPNATSSSTIPIQKGLFHGLRVVLNKKQSWLVAIYGGLMYAPTSIFGALWGVPFLEKAYGLNRPAAAGVISLLFVGWAVGGSLSGWFSDYIGKRCPPMIIGSIGALVTIFLILYINTLPIAYVSILLFSFGLFSSGFLPAFSVIREINPNNVSATALGFMNMMNMVGGALGQPLIGWLLDLTWDGKLQNGIRIYSTTNFQFALTLLPLCLVMAIIMLLFINEPSHKLTPLIEKQN